MQLTNLDKFILISLAFMWTVCWPINRGKEKHEYIIVFAEAEQGKKIK
jgi:hypothetical protein